MKERTPKSNGATALLTDRIKRWPLGESAAAWSLNILLPVAPTLDESLRIASQDWDAEVVEFYVVDIPNRRRSGLKLQLVKGRPIHLEGLHELQFAVHTDPDHRFHWRVTELSTGSAITSVKSTEAEAIASASGVCERYGADGVIRTLLSARERLAAAFANREAAPQRLTPVARGTAEILKGLGVDVEPGDLMERG